MAMLKPQRRMLLRGNSMIWLALLKICAVATFVDANICFMLYQNADGCGERSHRENLKDWIASEAIKDPSVTTWVYFNAFVSEPDPDSPKIPTGPLCGYIRTPLEDVWTTDGSKLLVEASSQKHEGGMYMFYDHADQKMKVYQELEEPPNNVVALHDFVEHALEDCMAKGSTDTFLTLNTYGTDIRPDNNHNGRRRLQKLQMTEGGKLDFFENDKEVNVNPPNSTAAAELVSRLSEVLQKQPEGGHKKLSVLGFDKPFNQGFINVNGLKTIAKNLLGSQSLVPEHGKYLLHFVELF